MRSLCAILLISACGSDGAVEPDAVLPIPDAGVADVAVEMDAGPPPCDPANHTPQTPTLLEPIDRTLAVEPDAIVLRSAPFFDPDGDAHAASEFEIWRLEIDVPAELVWRGTTASGAGLTEATLAQGQWQGSAATNGALDPWTWHMARVRHLDGAPGDCGTSAWSPEVRFRTEDGSAYLFDPTVVREFDLTIPPESWASIQAEAIPPGCVPWHRSYYTGDLAFEGRVMQGVGVHVKGGCGSARTLDGKAGLLVNLDWDDPAVPGCPERRELYGQRHLTLNNMVQDPSFAHERLAYHLYAAAGVPVSRVAYVRLNVNGAYWGLYLLVESEKRRFLDRRFQSKNGMLYEGTYWCDLASGNVPPADEDTYCLTREFSPDACDGAPEPDEDAQDYGPLRDMIAAVEAIPPDSFYPEIEALWDYDEFLSAWAVEGIIGHWDNYAFQIMNNYRVYHDPSTDRWSLIPHGVDQTFSEDRDPWNVSGALAARCRWEPDCEAALALRVHEVNEIFEELGLGAELDTIHELIKSHVYEDPRKEVANTDFDAQYPWLGSWIGWRPWRMREILASHGF